MSQPPLQPGCKVLIVDDEANIRRTLGIALEAAGHIVASVANPADALKAVGRESFDLAFVDLRLGTASGMDLIPRLLATCSWLRIVVITAHGSMETAIEAMRRGASDFLTKPFTPAQLEEVAARLTSGLAATRHDSTITLDSTSQAMKQVVGFARQIASSDAAVLVRGESGTGKGVLARAIHGWSGRGDKPFTTISAPSLSAQLLESELFGHVRGAFTGAVRDNPGRLAAADGGTLFLDEIGDLPLALQPKLLRLLQDKEYEPVGGTITRRADIRLIAATNIDLEAAVRDGRFREDLLYRVNVLQATLPPLRERAGDVAPLAERMLNIFARGGRPSGFTPEAAAALRAYRWPGNIRELRNVIERAVILCQGDQIGLEHLPDTLTARTAGFGAVRLGDPVPFEQVEEAHLRGVLRNAKTLEEAAASLGIDTATLWRKRRKYGL